MITAGEEVVKRRVFKAETSLEDITNHAIRMLYERITTAEVKSAEEDVRRMVEESYGHYQARISVKATNLIMPDISGEVET